MTLDADLYRVTLSYACFGVLAKEGRVTYAPPIGCWMVGKTVQEIAQWISSKRGTLEYCLSQ